MQGNHVKDLEQISKLIRYWILKSTTEAGSGHPTSCLSAVELMTALMFGGFFHADLEHPENPNNDRLIFSKGHAAPLLYALYAAATQDQKNKKTGKHHNSPSPPLNLRVGMIVGSDHRGVISEEELMTLRKFGSRLEGHPSMAFPYTEVPTGSLGQGLSIGVGMALAAKRFTHPVPMQHQDTPPQEGTSTDSPLERGGKRSEPGCVPRVFVLLGDSEMAEGSNWEAMQIAAYYKLDNLIGILDVNRLGQRGETMYGHKLREYEKRIKAFGWETVMIKVGNDIGEVLDVYKVAIRQAQDDKNKKPTMIVAKTLKGKGVSFLEDKEHWHGKALSRGELRKALRELGDVDRSVRGEVVKPKSYQVSGIRYYGKMSDTKYAIRNTGYRVGDNIATRDAYGNALVELGVSNPNIVVLDAELSDSTRAEKFKHVFPDRFFEMYIAEQNMVGVGLGFVRRGKIPFLSTFAAFFTRAFDQIRMAQYAFQDQQHTPSQLELGHPSREGNKKSPPLEGSRSDGRLGDGQDQSKAGVGESLIFVGSHGGVSIGQDGPSQMGLEDLAMFRTVQGSVVLYPSDAVSTEKLVTEAAGHKGIVYIRTTRNATPVIYKKTERFPIGGSKVLRKSKKDVVAVVGAGITLHEALKAYEALRHKGINIRVIDLYSIKPVDVVTLRNAAKETGKIIVVEDHVPEGGIADAVREAICGLGTPVISLAVRKRPKSGTSEELLEYEGIDWKAIVKAVLSSSSFRALTRNPERK